MSALSSALDNLVRKFYSDWSVVSPRQLAAYFTPEATLQTPLHDRVIIGANAIAGNIEIFRARFENVDVEVVSVAATGNIVLCEHLWHYSMARGNKFELAAQDAFTFAEQRISSWRSYFDPLKLTERVDLGES